MSDLVSISGGGIAARYAAQIRELLAHNNALRSSEPVMRASPSAEQSPASGRSSRGAVVDVLA